METYFWHTSKDSAVRKQHTWWFFSPIWNDFYCFNNEYDKNIIQFLLYIIDGSLSSKISFHFFALWMHLENPSFIDSLSLPSIKHIIVNLSRSLLILSDLKWLLKLNQCSWTRNKNNNLSNRMEKSEFHFIHLSKFSSYTVQINGKHIKHHNKDLIKPGTRW